MNNNRILNLVVAAAVAAVVAFSAIKFSGSGAAKNNAFSHSKGTLEKALSSGVIRCGYVVQHPNFINDPQNKKISGIFPEVLEKAAEILGMKVEWIEEVA